MVASPNPAKNTINLNIAKVADTSSNIQQSLKAIITNTTGITKMYLYDFNTNALVKQWSYQEMETTNYSYLLKLERDNKTTTTKILVQ
jgi:hypothetical protein